MRSTAPAACKKKKKRRKEKKEKRVGEMFANTVTTEAFNVVDWVQSTVLMT